MVLLIASLSLILAGLITWHFNFNPFIGYLVGFILGITLIICLLKKLAQWAIKSLIAWTILTSILSYKITSHLAKAHGYKVKEEIQSPNVDYSELKLALRGLDYSPVEIKNAIIFINDNPVKGSLEDKITVALKYLGNGHNELIESRG